MNVLILGSGGREHTLAWKIAQSNKLDQLFIAPGNAGTESLGTNVSIDPSNFEAIKELVLKHQIRMVVVGPEDPLVNGIKDFFLNQPELKNVMLIGPPANGAILEGSKDYAKAFMKKYHIPTAGYKSVTINNIHDGVAFIKKLNAPYVLKADGLAAGKGVVILHNQDEAIITLNEMLKGKFGEASKKVVIEEFLDGIELSVFVLTDGIHYKILPEAKDYKKIGVGDTGLNTGGMGAVSPVPFANTSFMEKVEQKIIKPTINGLKQENIKYQGFIFFGLINVENEPLVIEYNVRLGDPETEVVLPRIKNDLLSLLEACAQTNLHKIDLDIDHQTTCTVMLVSGGYPGSYEKGKSISSIEKVDESIIFHAGTKIENNILLTNGGRVLAITSYGDTIDKCLGKSYKNADIIQFDGKYFRNDIGFDLK